MKKLLVIAAAVAFTGSTFAQSAPATQTTKSTEKKTEAKPATTSKTATPAATSKTAAPAATEAAPAKKTSTTHHSSAKKSTEKKSEAKPAAATTK